MWKEHALEHVRGEHSWLSNVSGEGDVVMNQAYGKRILGGND